MNGMQLKDASLFVIILAVTLLLLLLSVAVLGPALGMSDVVDNWMWDHFVALWQALEASAA